MSDQPNLWRRDITWEEGCLSTTRALWCWTKNVYYIQQTILLVTSVLVSIVMKLHSSDRYEGVTSGSHQYSHLACSLVVSMYCQNMAKLVLWHTRQSLLMQHTCLFPIISWLPLVRTHFDAPGAKSEAISGGPAWSSTSWDSRSLCSSGEPGSPSACGGSAKKSIYCPSDCPNEFGRAASLSAPASSNNRTTSK